MNKKRRKAPWIIGILAVLLVTQCIGVWIPGLHLVAYLLIGWISFIRRVTSQISIRWDLVASTAIYVAVLTVGCHLFFRWLHGEMQRAGSSPETTVPRVWKWRSTVGILSLVLVMFAAGTAAVGIAHQTSWLARSPEPLYRRGNGRIQQLHCSMNLKQLGYALEKYSIAHAGAFPDDWRGLFIQGDLTAEVFICPGSEDERATGLTDEQAADKLLTPGHCSYIYLGKGLQRSRSDSKVVAVEPLENHDGTGINVLYADGHTAWLDRPDAESLLISLGFQRVENPTTQP